MTVLNMDDTTADDVVVDYEADEESGDHHQLIDEEEEIDMKNGRGNEEEEENRKEQDEKSALSQQKDMLADESVEGYRKEAKHENVATDSDHERKTKRQKKMSKHERKPNDSDSSSSAPSSPNQEESIRENSPMVSKQHKRGYASIDQNSSSNNSKRPRMNSVSLTNTERKPPIRQSYGVYIPPFRRQHMEENENSKKESITSRMPEDGQLVDAQNTESTPSVEEQRQAWENLKRSINGTINRLNTDTIKPLIHSLFQNANLIRGKGLLVKALLRAAITSPTYAHVYTALLAVINTKLPEIGELVLVRSIITFRRSFRRREKSLTLAVTEFIGHLFNQGLCHELLCLQILTVLLEGDVTDDGVEVSVKFLSVIGMSLLESTPAGVHAVMEQLRKVLQDGKSIGRRVLLKIENIIKDRKKDFRMYPSIEDELDLVEREEQIMFEIGLDDEGLKKEEQLDYFHFDPNYNQGEDSWLEIRKEILGEDEDDDDESNDDEESESDEDSDEHDEDGELEESGENKNADDPNKKQITTIHDLSESDLVHLRRTIYLTIMSSATFEECTHKLSRTDIPEGKEMELINMIIECCSQERTFLRYYGLISARFCLLHDRWRLAFEQAFQDQYSTIHRLETNKLRNVAKLFAHLLHTDSIPWSCLSIIHLNEDETTSSSRIFLKILMQEMTEALGMATIVRRFECDRHEVKEWCKDIFPKDNPRNTRYAVNFFTSIGLGPLTDGLRDYLKNAPKIIVAQANAEAAQNAIEESSDEDSSSESSTDSSSLSSSSSESASSTSSRSSYTSSSSYTSYSSEESSVSRRKKRYSRRKKSSKKASRRSRSSSSDSDSNRKRKRNLKNK